MKVCLLCNQSLPLTSFGANGKLLSGEAKIKPRCFKCDYLYEKKRFYTKVFEIVGGRDNYRCSKCGYNKVLGALEFHHLDPVLKDRPLSKMQNYSKAKLQIEISKCKLLCCLCHREIHEEMDPSVVLV
jgi:hypothetical protein